MLYNLYYNFASIFMVQIVINNRNLIESLQNLKHYIWLDLYILLYYAMICLLLACANLAKPLQFIPLFLAYNIGMNPSSYDLYIQ